MDEKLLLLPNSTDDNLSEAAQLALSKLAKHFDTNTSIFCGRRFRLKSHVEGNPRIEQHVIYIGNLHTLVEQRCHVKKCRPYNGNEICPNNPIGDIWNDYEFEPPTTTILKSPSLCVRKDLDQTRRREECSECQNNQNKHCSSCNDQRSIVVWNQLNVQWLNRSSNSLFSTTNQNSDEKQIVEQATNKKKCLDFDDVWSSDRDKLDDILDQCYDLPDGFRDDLNQKFLSNQKSDKILRLKCTIECLSLTKIDYHLKGLRDRTFTFYLVGEDQELYADASSYPSSSQQYRMTCCLL